MTRDPRIPADDEWAADLARLRAAIGEPALLREARPGDVITIPGHWPFRVTLKAVTADDDYHRPHFRWITWTGPGASGREWRSGNSHIGVITRAPRPEVTDDTLADLRDKLMKGEGDGQP